MEIYLTFHGLGTPGEHVPDSDRPYWVPLDRYHAILDVIANATNKVGLTFDDGNRSDIELGLPALQQHGLTAIFFVVSERIGTPSYLSADEIRALDRAGMGIGSHGISHVRWTDLPDNLITHQVSSSMAVLSEILGKRVDSVAVPFGAYDRRVLTVIRRLRVARVYTSDFGPVVPGSWIVARNTVRINTPLTEIKTMVNRRHSTADGVRARVRQLRLSLSR